MTRGLRFYREAQTQHICTVVRETASILTFRAFRIFVCTVFPTGGYNSNDSILVVYSYSSHWDSALVRRFDFEIDVKLPLRVLQ
jgi:hypothetical protein